MLLPRLCPQQPYLIMGAVAVSSVTTGASDTHVFALSSHNTRPRHMYRRVPGLQIVGLHAQRSHSSLRSSWPCSMQHNCDGTAAVETHDPMARRCSYVTPEFAWSPTQAATCLDLQMNAHPQQCCTLMLLLPPPRNARRRMISAQRR